MHAVMKTGGHQYRVTQGDIVDVEKLPFEIGEQVTIGDVLLASDEGEVRIGAPVLENAKVVARVLSHPLDDKITVGKFKRRKRYQRKAGHRQQLTRIRIEDIVL
jgi:large subunit ribosomal protein L21